MLTRNYPFALQFSSSTGPPLNGLSSIPLNGKKLRLRRVAREIKALSHLIRLIIRERNRSRPNALFGTGATETCRLMLALQSLKPSSASRMGALFVPTKRFIWQARRQRFRRTGRLWVVFSSITVATLGWRMSIVLKLVL